MCLKDVVRADVKKRSGRVRLSGAILTIMAFGLFGMVSQGQWWIGDACTVGIAAASLMGNWMRPDGLRVSEQVEVGWRDVWESLTTWKRVDRQHDE